MSIPFTWVYLIHDPFTNLYKIGKSDKPEERLKQLCSPKSYGTIPAAPTDYDLYEAWLCPEAWEKSLHERFEPVRIRGEWFDLARFYNVEPGMAGSEFEDELMLDQITYSTRTTGRKWSEDILKLRIMKLDAGLKALLQQCEHAKLSGYMPLQLAAGPEESTEEAVYAF